MSSELQLDVRHLNQWRRHLVNAYEVKAGTVFTAGKTVWSMPERLSGLYAMQGAIQVLCFFNVQEEQTAYGRCDKAEVQR